MRQMREFVIRKLYVNAEEGCLWDKILFSLSKTILGKQYDLIIEEGELKSQQYKTDIGSIDILAKDKKTGSFVVIELKPNK